MSTRELSAALRHVRQLSAHAHSVREDERTRIAREIHDELGSLLVALKLDVNWMAKRVTDLAMQVHGGNGYTEEFGLERLHRDAHGWAIAGGTPAMQRTRIVSELLGRSFDQRR